MFQNQSCWESILPIEWREHEKFGRSVREGFHLRIICLLVACFSAHAETSGSKELEIQLTLYGLLVGHNGTVATLPGLPPTEIDIDFFDDILGNINFALFLVGEAHKGRSGRELAAYQLQGRGHRCHNADLRPGPGEDEDVDAA